MISLINIFELLDRVSGKELTMWQIFLLDILQVPSFIEDIAIFLVMLASMITLFSLSIRSEITIMRASGLSFWQILSPIALAAFLLGLFFVLIFNPISITASKKLDNMQRELISKESSNMLAPLNGIWLKQDNPLNKDENIIIRAQRIYRENLQMNNVSLWFFDKDDKFYKRIDAKNMILSEGRWELTSAIINDDNNINKVQNNLKISTNLEAQFITKKIINNFENVRLFSVYSLPSLIDNLQDSGFSPRKFLVYYHSLLVKPFLFVAMSLMAAFFAINNVRSRNNSIIFVTGIAVGLVFYVSLVIVGALGSSGLIPIFLATWMTAIILMIISILLIFRKEIIN
ncbi:MAG: lipopolysaccharide export system permease protein [Myxococcota bacterium]